MSIVTTLPGEMGEAAADSIRDALDRAVGGDSVASYIEGEPPISWEAIAAAGWDEIGADEDTSLRDLVEVGIAWGRHLVALPLLTSIVLRRHLPATIVIEGPLTLSIPTSASTDGWGVVPYGQVPGISVVRDVASGSFESMPDGVDSDFDPATRSTSIAMTSSLTPACARELQAVWAGEAAGIARRAVNDAVAFAAVREQFGRPIGSFQAVKHHLANAHVGAEQSETAAIWASLEPANAGVIAEHALGQAIRAVELAVQVHGGLGFTWELGLHFSLRHLVRLRELVGGLQHV